MSWIDTVMILLVLTDLAMLGSSRLGVYVRLAALQGVLVGVLPLLVGHGIGWETAGVVVTTIGVKSVLFPWLMSRIMRGFEARREKEPYVGYTASLFLGVIALGIALWVSRHLPSSGSGVHPRMMPAALFSMFAGLVLIVSRRKAVTQALGYLVMENGIYVAGMALVPDSPLLVELGVLLDVVVGVFLMGIIIFHIHREFDHIETDQLSALSDWKTARVPESREEATP